MSPIHFHFVLLAAVAPLVVVAVLALSYRGVVVWSGRHRPTDHTLASYAIGFYVVVVAFLLPYPGRADGVSFLEVARSSPWRDWGDWAAAWCSLKIILLSLGAFIALCSCGTAIVDFTRKPLGGLLMVLIVSPMLGFWAGVYYLVKAVF